MFSFSALLAVAGATELQYAGEDLEKSTSWKASSLEFSDSLWPKEATYYIVIVHILAFLPAWLCSVTNILTVFLHLAATFIHYF